MTTSGSEDSGLFPGEGFFLTGSDRGVYHRTIRMLAQGRGHVVVHSTNSVLLDHYSAMLLRDLRARDGCLVEVYRPSGATRLLEQFNEILSTLSIDEARQNPRNLDQPVRIWLVQDLENLPGEEIDLLARLIRDFPSSGIVLLLLGYGLEEVPSSLQAIFRANLLAWQVDWPSADDWIFLQKEAVSHGYRREVDALLQAAGEGAVTARTSSARIQADEVHISAPRSKETAASSEQNPASGENGDSASAVADAITEPGQRKNSRSRWLALSAILLPGGLTIGFAGFLWLQSEGLVSPFIAIDGLSSFSGSTESIPSSGESLESASAAVTVETFPEHAEDVTHTGSDAMDSGQAADPEDRPADSEVGRSIIPTGVTLDALDRSSARQVAVLPRPGQVGPGERIAFIAPLGPDRLEEREPEASASPVTVALAAPVPVAMEPVPVAMEPVSTQSPVVPEIPQPSLVLPEPANSQPAMVLVEPANNPPMPPALPLPPPPLSLAELQARMDEHGRLIREEDPPFSWYVQLATYSSLENAWRGYSQWEFSGTPFTRFVQYRAPAGTLYYSYLQGPFPSLAAARRFIQEVGTDTDYWVRIQSDLIAGFDRL